jgi:hypothetical protein
MGGSIMAWVPGARDAYGGDPAGGQQHAERVSHLPRVRAAWRGKAQPGQVGWVNHVQVQVDIQRPAR